MLLTPIPLVSLALLDSMQWRECTGSPPGLRSSFSCLIILTRADACLSSGSLLLTALPWPGSSIKWCAGPPLPSPAIYSSEVCEDRTWAQGRALWSAVKNAWVYLLTFVSLDLTTILASIHIGAKWLEFFVGFFFRGPLTSSRPGGLANNYGLWANPACCLFLYGLQAKNNF